MKQIKWQIKLKIVDEKARSQGKKAVLLNIDVEIPTELIDGVFWSIGRELTKLESRLQSLEGK